MELLRYSTPQYLPRTNATTNRRPIHVNAAMSKSTLTTTVLETPAKLTPPVKTSLTPLLRVSPSSLQYEQGKLGAKPDHLVTDGPFTPMEYLTNILTSKVYDMSEESPLARAENLSARLGVDFWIKREDLHPVSTYSTLRPAGPK